MKPCSLCDKPRFKTFKLCYSHLKEHEKAKKLEKLARKKLRKESSKKFQKTEQKKWHAKCWKLMSERVRTKTADWKGMVECYTCYRSFLYKEMHCGHYQHGKLDFDSRNLKPQCTACNTYHGGRLDEYTLHLIKDYGLEWVQQLKIDAARHPGYKLEELKEIYLRLKSL